MLSTMYHSLFFTHYSLRVLTLSVQNKMSPLHYAAGNDAREVAALLLQRGAIVNARMMVIVPVFMAEWPLTNHSLHIQ